MKRKQFFTCVKTLAFSLLLLGGLLTSCATDGYDEESFTSSVRDAVLTSPTLEKSGFSTITASDGTEYIQVTWSVVHGAGGYECAVSNVDDPGNPVLIKKDTVDSPTFSFPKAEDTNYSVSVRTLGNARFNNTEAAEPTIFAYSTLVEAKIIPAGTEISQFIKDNLVDSDAEQAFELEAGGSYTLDGEIDFRSNMVTFRGNKVHRPIVTLGTEGVIRTSNGVKVKFINFDCTQAINKGVIEGSKTSHYNAPIGPKNNAYIMEQPILIQECMFKNVNLCLFYTGEFAWGINDLRINDCIIQLDNDGTKFGDAAVICTYSGTSSFEGGQSWNAIVKSITIKNSTIYNIKDNSKNRMIRFLSNNPSRVYATSDGSASITNCTFSKVMSNKEFANNTPNREDYSITFLNNVCYDVFRLQKFIQGNNVKCPTYNVNPALNTIWGVTNPVDATDKTRCATEEDPGFDPVAVLQPLDLTLPNGGVNFKAHGTISSTIGDPRWLSAE